MEYGFLMNSVSKLGNFSLDSFKSKVKVSRTSLVAQKVKHLPAMRETWVRSLGWENPLEKEMATHSSTLAWKIPWMEEPGNLQSMGSQRVSGFLMNIVSKLGNISLDSFKSKVKVSISKQWRNLQSVVNNVF